MPGFVTLSLGGYTIIFVLTFLILLAILFGIFVYRQIQRLRNNSARKEINSSVASELSKKSREAILRKIEAVHSFRKVHFPKFTDCTMISEHANTPYVHRMIAFDEIIRDVDRQLEFINGELVRWPGESTYCYLKRIKTVALAELDDTFIARLGFLHEWSKSRTEMPFGEQELEEVRSLLKTFLKILNKNQQLTSLNFPHNSSTKSRSLEQSSAAKKMLGEKCIAHCQKVLVYQKKFHYCSLLKSRNQHHFIGIPLPGVESKSLLQNRFNKILNRFIV
uniref:Uncharacterized protein n=1 Tax=Ditylenchus dipsaci TaxID=166011 RepID=A0A915EDA0_9BILA